MPSVHQILYLFLLWFGFALGGNVATQVLKTPLRLFWKRKCELRGDSLALYNWTVRLIPIVACTLLSGFIHAWPSYVAPVWTLILGSTAGLCSVAVYHAWKKTLPLVIGVLPDAIRKRLGG